MNLCTIIDIELNCGQLIEISVISEKNGITVRQTVHVRASCMPTHIQPIVNWARISQTSIPHTRGGMIPHTIGGIIPHTRGGIIPHTRGGMIPHARGGMIPHTRGGMIPHTRGGMIPHTRGRIISHTRGVVFFEHVMT